MVQIRRRKVSDDVEKNIITGMIVSGKYCRDILPMFKYEYLQADYVKKVAKWVLDYYSQYDRAPGVHIKTIYDVEKENLADSESELTAMFLSELSDRYEEESFNWDHLLDQATNYFKIRSLDILSRKVSGYLGRGKVEEAEKEVRDYAEVAKSVSKWINPFDRKEIEDFFDNEDTDRLFKFPGALGEMAEWFERSQLIAFLGPMKRGKSFFLEELTIQAMTTRLRTVFISLEMSKRKVEGRIYRRIAGLPDVSGEVVYPVFDCRCNQEDTCKKSQRTNTARLRGRRDVVPEHPKKLRYRSCVYCREENNDDYVPAVWYWSEKRRKLSKKRVMKKVEEVKSLYGNNLRIIAYPEFSANFGNIERDLDNLEYTEGFVPDVVAVDYFDILAPEDRRLSERGNIDATWKMGKKLAGVKHCLVATVSQSTRKTFEKKRIRPTDTAEDIRKLAHSDMVFALNQRSAEKRRSIMGISVVVKRFGDFNEYRGVTVLQCLKLGQPFLDSEWEKLGEKGGL